MRTSLALRHPNATKTVLGLMAVLYLSGLLGVAHHLATADHHHHDADFGHQEASHSHQHQNHSVLNQVLVPGDVHSCCSHVHSSSPSVMPSLVRDLKVNSVTRLLYLPDLPSSPDALAQSHSWRIGDLVAQLCPGLVTMAAGRAPPVFLHA